MRARDRASERKRLGLSEVHFFDLGMRGGVIGGAAIREYAFDAVLPSLLQFSHVERLVERAEDIRLAGFANVLDKHAVGCGNLNAIGKLDEEAAISELEQLVGGKHIVEHHANLVAQAHLKERLGGAAVARRCRSEHRAVANELLDKRERGVERIDGRNQAGRIVRVGNDANHLMASALELGRSHAIDLAGRNRERDERRGHIDFGVAFLKRARHGILAANSANAQVDLRFQGTEHSRHGLAPALGNVAQTLEIFLEGKICGITRETSGNKARNAFHNRDIRTLELVFLHDEGIEAPRHGARGVRFAIDRELRDHSLRRRELALAAERHEHRGRANGGVETLAQALVRTHVQIGHEALHTLGNRGTLPMRSIRFGGHYMGGLVLRRAIGIQEFARNIDDSIAAPRHEQARAFGNRGNHDGFEIFLMRIADEFLDVLGGQSHRHALLALGNSQLSAIEAVIFLGNHIQIDGQAVAQLADGNGNAASAEVVAALDQAARVAAAEQALNLTLDGGVALLNLGARGLDAVNVLRFRGAGRTANAIAARAAAKQHDLVARSRALATHVVCRSRAHNGADFHALGHITGMIELMNLAGRKTDLVAIARIARGGGGHELALRELARQRFGNRARGVGRAGHAHGLVHVAAARKGVANRAAHARCRAAERLDLGGVIVGFVLEEEQPVLVFAVHVDGHLHRAGVDFLRLIDILHNTPGLEVLRANGAHVHEAHRLMLAAKFGAHGQVFVERGLHAGVVDGDIGKLGAERGVAAVVGPIGVDNLHLGNGGVAALFLEIALEERDVGQVHRQAALGKECLQARFVEVDEPVNNFDGVRVHDLHMQSLARRKGCLAGFNRVDDVMLDGVDIGGGKLALEHVHLGGAHIGTLALANELHAFACRVGALVELTRQEFHREHRHARRSAHASVVGDRRTLNGQFGRCDIGLRLAEYRRHALVE